MSGIDEFINLFGNVTVLDIIEFGLAVTFVICLYKKYKQHMAEKIVAEKKAADKEAIRDKEHQELMDSVRKYPEYRAKSIEVQQRLEDEIAELRKMYQETLARLVEIEERDNNMECNKLRDTLLRYFRYYTDPEKNPSRSWMRMEADAFWALFKDYEDRGGNGHMHSIVRPAMEELHIIEH